MLDGVSSDLFSAAKNGYGAEVVESVVEFGRLYTEEVVKLTNLTMAETSLVLARQRRDYGIDQDLFSPQYPVMEQAANIDDTPVNNIACERTCGKVDYRLQKLKNLDAVSRSIILQNTQQERENRPSDFRSYKEELAKVKELKLSWSAKMKEKQKEGSDEKQELAKQREEKRLDNLDSLKAKGGPFTDEREVDEYLGNVDIDEKEKVKRMKLELQFARDSSTLLPKTDPIFRIQITVPETGKRRQKNSSEFGAALRALLGKRSSREVMEYSSFKEMLEKVAAGQRDRGVGSG